MVHAYVSCTVLHVACMLGQRSGNAMLPLLYVCADQCCQYTIMRALISPSLQSKLGMSQPTTHCRQSPENLESSQAAQWRSG